MRLVAQKRLSADLLKCSAKRVKFDSGSLDAIKEAITKTDIKKLVKRGIILKKPARGVSRGRARFREQQKRKARRRGQGSRKGTFSARSPAKKRWVNRVRLQRSLLREMRERKELPKQAYNELYRRVKGGFFRSKRHLMLYIKESGVGK